MYNLFNLAGPANTPAVISGEWPTLKRNLRRNVGTVVSYYRKAPQGVPAQHYLVRLLHNLGIPMGLNATRYAEHADAVCYRLANMMQMFTPYQYGKTLNGEFYGKGVTEIIIGHDSIFNVEEAERNWENLTPIRVLHHPVNNLDMALPAGYNLSGSHGFAVIAIDIPKLAFQYRCWWLRDRLRAASSDANPMTTQQFVHMYVLPNMLFSQTDYVLFNRAHALATGYPLQPKLFRHPFMLPDYSKQVDGFLNKQIGYATKTDRNFRALLRFFPALYVDNFDKVLEVPEMPMTMQVEWAMWLARVYGADFLATLSKKGGMITNPQEYNAMRIMLRKLQSNNMFERVLTPSKADEVMLLIDDFMLKMQK